jgi:hypothetical protein
MARSTKKKGESGRKPRLRSIPWTTLLQGGVVVGSRWRRLSAKERERLRELMRQSRGRVDNLSDKDRKELRRLAGKLDLKGMGKELLALRAVSKRRRRRR